MPAGKLALPNYTYDDYGIPRYVVEVYRDRREPNVKESGYVWAWTCDTREVVEFDERPAEVSRYRQPSEFDIEHAFGLKQIIETTTLQSAADGVKKRTEQREAYETTKNTAEIERKDEQREKYIRNELVKLF